MATASGGERAEERALLARHLLDPAHALGVRGGDEREHADLGLGDAAELGDIAGLVHPHLDDGEAVPRLEAEQHHGDADAVVEVARRAVDLAGEEPLGERGDGDPGGGLARRSGDGDDGAVRPSGAPAAGVSARQVAERAQRRRDADDRNPGHRRDGALHDHGARARRGGRRDVIVPVVRLAAQGDEAAPVPDRARVRRDRGDRAGALRHELPARLADDLGDRERRVVPGDRRRHQDSPLRRRRPSARRASSRSSKASVTAPTIW